MPSPSHAITDPNAWPEVYGARFISLSLSLSPISQNTALGLTPKNHGVTYTSTYFYDFARTHAALRNGRSISSRPGPENSAKSSDRLRRRRHPMPPSTRYNNITTRVESKTITSVFKSGFLFPPTAVPRMRLSSLRGNDTDAPKF